MPEKRGRMASGGPRVTRRNALAAVAGAFTAAGLVGCRPTRSAPASTAHPAVPVNVLWNLPLPAASSAASLAALKSALPELTVWTEAPTSKADGVGWWLIPEPPMPEMLYGVDLTPGLREVNFNPDILLPGTVHTFTGSGHPTQTMPLSLQPLLVHFSVPALQAAGLTSPDSAWTLADFLTMCAGFDSAIRAGKLEALGIDQVLYPQRTDVTFTHHPAGGSGIFGGNYTAGITFADTPLLWETFITGFGGSVVQDGTSHWDSGPALNGLTQMLEIFSKYGAGPAPAGPTEPAPTWAMEFVEANVVTPPRGDVALAPGFAPFPLLPGKAVAPANSASWQLVWSSGGFGFGAPVPTASAGEAVGAAVTAARFLSWWYADAQQALFAASGVVPVTAAAAGQSRFWRLYGIGAPGVEVLLPYDFSREFSVVPREFPQFLQQVAADPASVPSVLRTLNANLSAALAKAQAAAEVN